MNTRLLIGNEAVDGDGAPEAILDPATGQVIAEVREASAEQVAPAVTAADRAFVTWSRVVPRDRAMLMLRLADAIDARAADLARLGGMEQGNEPRPV